jgi:hypothetical protein
MTLHKDELMKRPQDLVFVALLILCLIVGIASVGSQIDKRRVSLAPGGARKVELNKIRRQITEGHLSPKKALFYKRAPR